MKKKLVVVLCMCSMFMLAACNKEALAPDGVVIPEPVDVIVQESEEVIEESIEMEETVSAGEIFEETSEGVVEDVITEDAVEESITEEVAEDVAEEAIVEETEVVVEE